MAGLRVRPTDVELVNRLAGFNKSYFTVSDLEKVLGLERDSLLVTLTRLVKSGVLVRVRRGVYGVFTGTVDVEKVGCELYYPAYLSFETALSHYGILSQVPYTVTFATTRSSKKMRIGNSEVEYSSIKKDLFFGYKLENGLYIAEPEKALLDQLYMVSRGRRSVNIEELDLTNVDRDRLEEYAKKFPKYTNGLLNDAKGYLGSMPITNENNERITRGEG